MKPTIRKAGGGGGSVRFKGGGGGGCCTLQNVGGGCLAKMREVPSMKGGVATPNPLPLPGATGRSVIGDINYALMAPPQLLRCAIRTRGGHRIFSSRIVGGGGGGGGGGGRKMLSASGPIQNAFMGSIALGRQIITSLLFWPPLKPPSLRHCMERRLGQN